MPTARLHPRSLWPPPSARTCPARLRLMNQIKSLENRLSNADGAFRAMGHERDDAKASVSSLKDKTERIIRDLENRTKSQEARIKALDANLMRVTSERDNLTNFTEHLKSKIDVQGRTPCTRDAQLLGGVPRVIAEAVTGGWKSGWHAQPAGTDPLKGSWGLDRIGTFSPKRGIALRGPPPPARIPAPTPVSALTTPDPLAPCADARVPSAYLRRCAPFSRLFGTSGGNTVHRGLETGEKDAFGHPKWSGHGSENKSFRAAGDPCWGCLGPRLGMAGHRGRWVHRAGVNAHDAQCHTSVSTCHARPTPTGNPPPRTVQSQWSARARILQSADSVTAGDPSLATNVNTTFSYIFHQS